MSLWRSFEQQIDAMVDQYWGEPVELHPMIPGSVTGDPTADPARPVINTTCVFMRPGAKVVGEGGDSYSRNGAQQVASECWISIQDARLGGNIFAWKQHDRIYLPERDQWFEINYISPSATGRPDIHLLIVQTEAEQPMQAPAPMMAPAPVEPPPAPAVPPHGTLIADAVLEYAPIPPPKKPRKEK